MSNLVFNPDCKDYFKAKACVGIFMRYNYAGSYRSYSFMYLSFRAWSSSFRAAFCYVFKRLEEAVVNQKPKALSFLDICDIFVIDKERFDFYVHLEEFMRPYFSWYFVMYRPFEKLSFVYLLTLCLSRYYLGEIRYDLVSPMFEVKSAIRYAASKYFLDVPFIEIESDFIFKDVMD